MYLNVQEVAKGPLRTQRSKRYLKIKKVSKGTRGNTKIRNAVLHTTGKKKYKLKKYNFQICGNLDYRCIN